jgi:hypothetical protein
MLKLIVYGFVLLLLIILISITRELAFRGVEDHKPNTTTQRKTAGMAKEILLEKLSEIEFLPDLSEVKGIGPKYKELLSASGFNDIYMLVECEADALVEKVRYTNKWAMIVKQTPPRHKIENWQESAKTLIKTLSCAPLTNISPYANAISNRT